MWFRLQSLAYRTFGRLPRWLRRRIMRVVAPLHTVGAVCFVVRGDGAVLLVRHSYNRRWGTVGGFLGRGEAPDDAVRREAREEVGMEVELVGEPAVVVDPQVRRVDVVWLARPAGGSDTGEAAPSSAEILEVGWFPPDSLPDISNDTRSSWESLARRGDLPPAGGPPST